MILIPTTIFGSFEFFRKKWHGLPKKINDNQRPSATPCLSVCGFTRVFRDFFFFFFFFRIPLVQGKESAISLYENTLVFNFMFNKNI